MNALLILFVVFKFEVCAVHCVRRLAPMHRMTVCWQRRLLMRVSRTCCSRTSVRCAGSRMIPRRRQRTRTSHWRTCRCWLLHRARINDFSQNDHRCQAAVNVFELLKCGCFYNVAVLRECVCWQKLLECVLCVVLSSCWIGAVLVLCVVMYVAIIWRVTQNLAVGNFGRSYRCVLNDVVNEWLAAMLNKPGNAATLSWEVGFKFVIQCSINRCFMITVRIAVSSWKLCLFVLNSVLSFIII